MNRYAYSERSSLIPYLINKIEIILKKNPQGISEYELISHLKKEPDNDLEQINLQDSLELFQIHFMVMHSLYSLRDRWLAEKTHSLQISPMLICVMAYSAGSKEELTEIDHLRAYYLDLSHLENTDAEAADNLISSFWEKYIASPDRLDALAMLGLDEGVSFEQIKLRYRQLAMEIHPDRGGCSRRFADITQAMNTLKTYYQ